MLTLVKLAATKLGNGYFITIRKFNKPKSLIKTTSNFLNAINEAENIVELDESILKSKEMFKKYYEKITSQLSKYNDANNFRKLEFLKQIPRLQCLIILLVSKAGDTLNNKSYQEHYHNSTGSQRIIETFLMMQAGKLIHGMNTKSESDKKLNLVIGDLILSKSMIKLAAFDNCEIFKLFFEGFKDMLEADFIESRTMYQNEARPAKPVDVKHEELNNFDNKLLKILGRAKPEWILRHSLSTANFIANSCQSALILANQQENIQKSAHLLGLNLQLSFQAHFDVLSIYNMDEFTFNLINAPLMFHLQYDPSSFEKILKNPNDFNGIKIMVQNGPGVERTVELKEELCRNSLQALKDFPENDSKQASINILNSLL